MSEPRRDLADVLRELGWTIHRRAPERAGVGPIPTTEVALLKQVVENPGATVGELAQALGLRQPNVSRAVATLCAQGLVTKESSPTDRRITHVRATDLGRSEHEAITAGWSEPIEAALSSLSEKHQRTLGAAEEALTALYAALRGSDELPR
ncbi:MarR family winged helix-turn-helix transcriptional regulator [Nocardioides sp. Kera G14]|uniref:MarR family winged helix-turn-helix transcriptional regulator n=1 Tax=Nocardioides sp. Kera G14 TaxID=2884264 RepID=UPI001D0F52BF|nr:MarR family transcriptional regulator [Nocardioides sp. Kera G14]UDY23464.1 MarR family transcriptional regulator [Nocardioides sp. Kera G14]